MDQRKGQRKGGNNEELLFKIKLGSQKCWKTIEYNLHLNTQVKPAFKMLFRGHLGGSMG